MPLIDTPSEMQQFHGRTLNAESGFNSIPFSAALMLLIRCGRSSCVGHLVLLRTRSPCSTDGIMTICPISRLHVSFRCRPSSQLSDRVHHLYPSLPPRFFTLHMQGRQHPLPPAASSPKLNQNPHWACMSSAPPQEVASEALARALSPPGRRLPLYSRTVMAANRRGSRNRK
jgi:hypothetical protein